MNQKRYLGLDLAGAKNAKTTLAVLEYYPKEKKVFVLDVHPGIGADETSSSDEVLIQTLLDHADGHPDLKLGVNVPLSLPPCISCTRKSCPLPQACTVAEVKWMRNHSVKSALTRPRKKTASKRNQRLKEFFTPYTQRPLELYLKHEILPALPEKVRFEIDETLGGNKAPLTARMHFLKFHLKHFEMLEVLPKLTAALLGPKLRIPKRVLADHRHIEDGLQARQLMIERMCENLDIFIYDRDLKKITQSLNAFDAFLSAYTVLLHDRGECLPPPRGFPIASGWVCLPKSPLLDPEHRQNSSDEEED
jgi:hypothetical protein